MKDEKLKKNNLISSNQMAKCLDPNIEKGNEMKSFK